MQAAAIALTAAGFVARPHPAELDVLRVYMWSAATGDTVWRKVLCGEVVFRDGRITYAEHCGRVFPFWSTGSYEAQREAYYRAVTTR